MALASRMEGQRATGGAAEWAGLILLLTGFLILASGGLALLLLGGVALKVPYFVHEFAPWWIAMKAAAVPTLGAELGPPVLLLGPFVAGFAVLKIGLMFSDAANEAKAQRKD